MSKNETRDAAIVALKHYGFGPRKIARAMELTFGEVSGVLFRAGLTDKLPMSAHVPSETKRGRPPVDRSIREAAVEYSWKHTIAAASAKFGVSVGAIANWRSAA